MNKKKKILIADPSTALIDAITLSKGASDYEFTFAKTGPSCLKMIKEVEPDLAIIDLMMPHIHGFEILKTIKTNPRTASMGIIITSYHVMVQNYHAVIEEGADYFLVKPFELPELFELIDAYFKGELKPAPFALKSGHEVLQNHCYHPIPSTLTSYLRFLGNPRI